MPQRVYASVSDYADQAEEPSELAPAKLAKRLRSASSEVDGLTRMAVYDADEDGMPTDAEVSDAFLEATCAIVEYWETTDDPDGAESNVGAVKIGSVSLGTTSSREVDSAGKLEARIGPKALTILRNAGIYGQPSY